jgi:hypothetical protein
MDRGAHALLAAFEPAHDLSPAPTTTCSTHARRHTHVIQVEITKDCIVCTEAHMQCPTSMLHAPVRTVQ